jgi:hypothetical protein
MRYQLETHKQRTDRVLTADIDFDDFRRRPLDPATLRCLRYMHDVEHHTICYLRDVLVTDAHRDVEITTFLSFWAFEEYWHGEAIGQVLEAHGEASEPRIEETRRRQGWRDRVLPLGTMIASALSPSVPAVHMTWGAVNEWTTQAAYGRLAARADHPTLRRLLQRIMRQEGRHIDFYASQAAARLDGSASARRLARWTLERIWTPVGAGIHPNREVRFLATHLFGGPDGLAAIERIDRQVDRLPGLDGLHLLRRARGRLVAPAADSPRRAWTPIEASTAA